jgi:hypothetical protein
MKQTALTSNLHLLEQPIDRPVSHGAEPENMNHIWVWDRSGSMAGLIRDLVNDLIDHVKALKIGDSISLGWFSGQGDCNWVVKGFKLSQPADYGTLETMLRANDTIRNTTCFSEILGQTNQVVEDLKAIMPDFALCFFTDGYPVVQNYQREIESITQAIAKVQGKLASVLLVGYGGYYNKELMASMAQQFGGTLVHSSQLEDFSKALTEFVIESREYGVKVSVTPKVESERGVYFSVDGKTIRIYKTENGKISFAPSRKGRNSLYVLTNSPVTGAEVEDVNSVSSIRAALAAAFVLTQTCRSHLALEVLGSIGDVALIDAVNNSWTNSEYGRTETLLRKAIASPQARFLKGIDHKYLPRADAFCVLDAVNALLNDENARFYPYFPGFQYNRIGLKAEVKESVTAKFTPDANPSCSLENMVWHDTRLNLSLTAKIPGTVNLGGDCARFGFSQTYPTFIWRSYSFVKDGNVNVPEAPFSMSHETYAKLKAQGMIDMDWAPEIPVFVHLDRIPVMNRSIADGKTSAKDLCAKALQELKLEAEIKVLKAAKVKLETSGARNLARTSVLTAGQVDFLKCHYVGHNGYDAPTADLPSTDYYMAKEFSIKIKGCSSLPKLEAVEEKLKKKGVAGLTVSENLVYAGMRLLESAPAGSSQRLTWIISELSLKTKQLRTIRKEIQRTKFAVLLGKRWFDQWTSRENCQLELEGYTFTVDLREVKVEI